MSNVLLKGVYPALVTPFDGSMRIDTGTVEKLINYNYSNGARGYYICGTTGEGPVLPLASRMELAEAVTGVNSGRGVIINHVGAASPKDTFELARHANRTGCTAVSSVLPNFFFKYSEDEIIEYYKRLAHEAALPVIAYAQSFVGGMDTVSLMSRLIKIDGVIGVKFTLTDFYSMRRIKDLNGGDINVINGPDEMFLCGLSMGADAGIGSTYNVMCREYAILYELFSAGELTAAQLQQRKINRIVEIIIRHGVIRTIKYMLSFNGIEAGSTAFPATPLSDEEKSAIRAELIAAGFFTDYNKN